MSVRIARAAAKNGIRAYRFDSSGIGDSETRKLAGSHEERLVSEICEVMDELSSQEGIKQFVLCGLCSGADSALATAVLEPRVVGIVQLDPMFFRIPKWYFYHYYPRILDINCWLGKLKHLFGKDISAADLPSDYLLPDLLEDTRSDPDRQSLTSAYENLVSRGVHIMVVMTTGQRYRYNARGQFCEAFKQVNFGSLLEEYYLPEAQHTINEPEDQEFVINLVRHWSMWDQV
ncbi:MAG: hypothetical protein HKN34_10080 [Gammaproteobacteria bacterium]|nr:hypothetical protein [Gammaproteobacteria bacterium]